MKNNPLLIAPNLPYISNDLVIQVLTVTPEMAEEMLTHNTDNYRPLNPQRVAFYAKEITEGRWIKTAQGISFDVNGCLDNGQHRLSGIVASRIGVTMAVAVGQAVAAGKIMDRPLVRNNSSVLQNEMSFKNAKRLEATANIIRSLLGRTRSTIFVPELYATWIRPYEPDIHEVIAFNGTKALCVGFVNGPVVLAFQKLSEKKRQEVREGLYLGSGLTTGNPLLTVRDYVLRNNASTRKGMGTSFDRDEARDRAVKVLTALAAFDQGKEMRHLYGSEATAFTHFGLTYTENRTVRVRRTTGAYAEV